MAERKLGAVVSNWSKGQSCWIYNAAMLFLHNKVRITNKLWRQMQTIAPQEPCGNGGGRWRVSQVNTFTNLWQCMLSNCATEQADNVDVPAACVFMLIDKDGRTEPGLGNVQYKLAFCQGFVRNQVAMKTWQYPVRGAGDGRYRGRWGVFGTACKNIMPSNIPLPDAAIAGGKKEEERNAISCRATQDSKVLFCLKRFTETGAQPLTSVSAVARWSCWVHALKHHGGTQSSGEADFPLSQLHDCRNAWSGLLYFCRGDFRSDI